MLDAGGDWLVGLMADSGLAGFLAERARASRELDRVVLARCRPLEAGVDLGSYDASYGGGPERPDPRIARLLAEGGLAVDDAVRQSVALLAIAYACERSLSWEPDDAFRRRASSYMRRWRASLPGLTVAIGPGDSTPTYVSLGVFSSR